MHDIIIVGAGGLGREVYTWVKDNHTSGVDHQYRIKGFLDTNPDSLQGFNLSVGVLGCESTYTIEAGDRFIVALGDIDLKKRVVQALEEKGATFFSFVHHSAIVAPTARIGKGCVICPFVVISDQVTLEDYVMLNFHASCGHDARIGKYSVLSPYATLNGCTTLEDEVFLGTRATVVAGKKIGYRAKVSANSAVMHDAPAHAFVFGVPGKHRVIFN